MHLEQPADSSAGINRHLKVEAYATCFAKQNSEQQVPVNQYCRPIDSFRLNKSGCFFVFMLIWIIKSIISQQS